MFDIIGKKWYFFIFSAVVIIPGIVSLLFWGLRPALDFTGGTLLEIQNNQFTNQNSIVDLRKIAQSQKLEIGSIQTSGKNTYILKLKPINQNQNKKFQDKLKQKFGPVKEIRFETVGPSIGEETTHKAIIGVIIASVAIVLFITLVFRKIPKPYSSLKFGICAVVALIHDILVVVGIFSLLGHFYNVEIDSLFITALLTVMGFSVHDTIVVFDRIRENLGKSGGSSFGFVVNESIIQTLVRSLSTSLTVLFTLFALFLFGGESIKWFVIALLIGVASGTYSSVFNAAPLLVLWEEMGQRQPR